MTSALPLLALLLSAAPTPEAAADPAARLSHARELASGGDWAGAARALAPRPIDGRKQRCGPPLEGWCALLRAEALFYSGDAEGAAEEYGIAQALDPGGPVAGRAERARGEALMAAGKLTQAKSAIRAALSHGASPELLLSLAQVESELGEEAESRSTLLRLAASHPDHPAAVQAEQLLRQRSGKIDLDAGALVSRAERWLAIGLPKRALVAAHDALEIASAPAERAQAQYLEAKALFALKEYPLAELALSELGPGAPGETRAKAQLLDGRVALAHGDDAEAARRLDAAAAAPDEASADEARFLAAWSFFSSGDYPSCAARFDALVKQRPRSPRASEAAWYRGFCGHLAGDDGAARASLSSLTSHPSLGPQALYWLGRLAESPEQAAEHYQHLLRLSPFDWYSWLARQRLAELGRPAPPLTAAATATCPKPATDRERAAQLLSQIGMAREARDELEAAGSGNSDGRRRAELASCLGLHDLAYRLANRHLWPAAIAGDGAARGLLFPRAYRELVEEKTARAGLDPSFAWAIMRRESAFDPLARSPARAFGLMQLLHPVARKIAWLSGAQPPRLDELERPEQIVPLASWYLAQLFARFGHAALAAAAYNGGPSAAARWVAARSGRPLDEFVELIPYKETRLYVKGVMGDYQTYRALWGAQGPALAYPMSIPPAGAGVGF